MIQKTKTEDTEKSKIVKDILKKNWRNLPNCCEYAWSGYSIIEGLVWKPHQSSDENELDYQDVIDELYTRQNIVIVPQHMIKSSWLGSGKSTIQYQLNTEILISSKRKPY